MRKNPIVRPIFYGQSFLRGKFRSLLYVDNVKNLADQMSFSSWTFVQ